MSHMLLFFYSIISEKQFFLNFMNYNNKKRGLYTETPSKTFSTHRDPTELCIDPFIVTTHLCGLRHSRVRAKKKSTRRDVYFHLHTKLLTSYRSMYEVGTYNSEPVERWQGGCGARRRRAVQRRRQQCSGARRWRTMGQNNKEYKETSRIKCASQI